MKTNYLILPILFLSFYSSRKESPKKAVLSSVEKHQQELIQLSDQIWEYAETAMKETKSSKVLSEYAKARFQGYWRSRNSNGFYWWNMVADYP
jgi:aminobenzoyl-glutamate utilization protein B